MSFEEYGPINKLPECGNEYPSLPEGYYNMLYKPRKWFTGNCLWCDVRIKKYVYCVRAPLVPGGWYGCYCSWNHVRDSITPGPYTDYLVNKFEKECLHSTIYDI